MKKTDRRKNRRESNRILMDNEEFITTQVTNRTAMYVTDLLRQFNLQDKEVKDFSEKDIEDLIFLLFSQAKQVVYTNTYMEFKHHDSIQKFINWKTRMEDYHSRKVREETKKAEEVTEEKLPENSETN